MVARVLTMCAALVLLATMSIARAAEGAQDAPVHYRVVIDAPRTLADTLRNTLDIVRWQDYEDTTSLVLDRLMREARDQATEVAEAAGYFSAQVEVTLEPGADEKNRRTVRVQVVPGEPVRISGVTLDVTGPAATDADRGRAAIASLRETWLLPTGARFEQSRWNDAKQRAVATLASTPYAAARLVKSEALVDPATRSAALSVEIESGPFFRFGELDIEGVRDYDASLVRNFSTIAHGEPYTQERLDQYVRRLQASGYFASVQARIDADPAHADAASVRVSVIEAPRHRIEGGVGYSTDSSISSNFRYTDVNFNGRATQLEVTGRLDSKIQNLGFRFTRPPQNGYIDSLRGQVERTDIAGLDTRTALLGVHRQTIEERNRTGYALTYYEDDQRPTDLPRIRSRALYADYERTWRHVDALVAPTRGWVLNTEVGGAPLGTRLFGRVIAQSAWWVPLGLDDALFFRLEAGAVLARSREGIPSALLFRTGGDTTVRGYSYQSLGVQQNGVTVGGRYYAVASAEATHYFNDRFGVAVFVDAGNAGDNLGELRPAFGYGTGLRVKSPIGPFRVDVAYGQDSHQVRLHMSVGVTF